MDIWMLSKLRTVLLWTHTHIFIYTHTHIIELMFSVLLSGIQSHMVYSFTFWETVKIFSKADEPFYILTTSELGFPFIYSLVNTCILFSLSFVFYSHSEELCMEAPDIVQEAGIKTIPNKKQCKKAKWLSEEALQIAVKRREVKGKGEKERFECRVPKNSKER